MDTADIIRLLPWQSRVTKRLPLPDPMSWLVIALALFTVGAIIVGYVETEKANKSACYLCIFISALMVWTVPVAVLYYRKLLEKDFFPNILGLLDCSNVEKEAWKEHQRRIIFSPARNIIWAIGLAIVLGCSCYLSETPFRSPAGRAFQILLACATGFVGGSMLYVLYRIKRLMRDLGSSVKIKVDPFDPLEEALGWIPRFIMKICLIAVALFLVGVLLVSFREALMNRHIVSLEMLSDLRGLAAITFENLLSRDTPGQIIRLTFGLFLIGYFFVCHSGIVKMLKREKKRRRREKNKAMKEFARQLTVFEQDPSSDNLVRLGKLYIQCQESGDITFRPFLRGESLGALLIPSLEVVSGFLTAYEML